LIIVEDNKAPKNIKHKEAVQLLTNALKDEYEQLVVVIINFPLILTKDKMISTAQDSKK
jgi:hypothetical protein